MWHLLLLSTQFLLICGNFFFKSLELLRPGWISTMHLTKGQSCWEHHHKERENGQILHETSTISLINWCGWSPLSVTRASHVGCCKWPLNGLLTHTDLQTHADNKVKGVNTVDGVLQLYQASPAMWMILAFFIIVFTHPIYSIHEFTNIQADLRATDALTAIAEVFFASLSKEVSK